MLIWYHVHILQEALDLPPTTPLAISPLPDTPEVVRQQMKKGPHVPTSSKVQSAMEKLKELNKDGCTLEKAIEITYLPTKLFSEFDVFHLVYFLNVQFEWRSVGCLISKKLDMLTVTVRASAGTCIWVDPEIFSVQVDSTRDSMHFLGVQLELWTMSHFIAEVRTNSQRYLLLSPWVVDSDSPTPIHVCLIKPISKN